MSAKIIPSIIFLSAIIFIGAVTSYEDFKSSKIRNKWVVGGLVYSLIIYLFSWILYVLTKENILNHIIRVKFISYFLWNFDKWCVNLLISFLVAYLLWHFKIWGGGDAKLFIVYAALIPMREYSKIYFNYNFASFLLLISIFIPATIFILLKAFFYFIKKMNFGVINEKISKLIKEKLSKTKITNFLTVFLGFFYFFLFLRILSQEIFRLSSKILLGRNILILISLLMARPLSEFFRRKNIIVIIISIIFLIYFIIKIQSLDALYLLLIANTFRLSILLMFLIPLIDKIVNIYEDNAIRKSTPFAPWMFLGALITWFI